MRFGLMGKFMRSRGCIYTRLSFSETYHSRFFDVLTRHAWFIWGPGIAAILGGLFGGFSYDFLIYNGQDSPLNRPVARTAQDSAIDDHYED